MEIKNLDLFGNKIEPQKGLENTGKIPGRNKSGGYIKNPMISIYGEAGTLLVCKNCIHFVRKEYAKTYFKCQLRGNVDKCSVQSDHRANWPACGKYEDNGTKINIKDIQYGKYN